MGGITCRLERNPQRPPHTPHNSATIKSTNQPASRSVGRLKNNPQPLPYKPSISNAPGPHDTHPSSCHPPQRRRPPPGAPPWGSSCRKPPRPCPWTCPWLVVGGWWWSVWWCFGWSRSVSLGWGRRKPQQPSDARQSVSIYPSKGLLVLGAGHHQPSVNNNRRPIDRPRGAVQAGDALPA